MKTFLVKSVFGLLILLATPPGGSLLAPLLSQAQTEAEARTEEERLIRDKIKDLMTRLHATEDLYEQERLLREILRLDPLFMYALQRLPEVQEAIREEERLTKERKQREEKKLTAMESALAAYARGDLRTARSQVQEALRVDPDNREAISLQALIESDLRTRWIQWIVVGVLLLLLLAAVVVALIVFLRKKEGVLEVTEGPEAGRVIPLNGESTTLGALESEVDHALNDPNRRISRRHCTVIRTGKYYFLTDLSTNGTFVNRKPLPKGQPVLLNRGDEISLANEITLRFRYR